MPELYQALRAQREGDATHTRELLEELAESGDPRAAHLLGSLCSQGEGGPEDPAAAAIWYRRAADVGHAPAAFNLAALYALGRGVSQDYATAMRWYRRAADLGMAAAERMIGNMYGRGEGIDQDPAAALRWIRLAAEHGDREAMYQLGRLLEAGVNGDDATEPDLPEAARWYLEAGAGEDGLAEAARGLAVLAPHLQALADDDPAAACRLGQLRRLGAGVRRDPVGAARLLTAAAEAGHAEASYELGGMYRDGDGVEQDPAEAVRRYTAAAEAGLAAAQHDLAWMLWTGTGAEPDWDRALRWYVASAEQGDAQSMYDVALALLAIDDEATGEAAGRTASAARRVKAASWMRRAAEGGWVPAMPALGRAYATGDGLRRDPVQAARWFLAALLAGNGDGLHDLHELAGQLTADQVREADRLAGGDGAHAAALLAVAGG
jgi:TPR repeat protein